MPRDLYWLMIMTIGYSIDYIFSRKIESCNLFNNTFIHRLPSRRYFVYMLTFGCEKCSFSVHFDVVVYITVYHLKQFLYDTCYE